MAFAVQHSRVLQFLDQFAYVAFCCPIRNCLPRTISVEQTAIITAYWKMIIVDTPHLRTHLIKAISLLTLQTLEALHTHTGELMLWISAVGQHCSTFLLTTAVGLCYAVLMWC